MIELLKVSISPKEEAEVVDAQFGALAHETLIFKAKSSHYSRGIIYTPLFVPALATVPQQITMTYLNTVKKKCADFVRKWYRYIGNLSIFS